jgi:hypothetical protein
LLGLLFPQHPWKIAVGGWALAGGVYSAHHPRSKLVSARIAPPATTFKIEKFRSPTTRHHRYHHHRGAAH